jgi:hypothetical protein
MVSVGKKERRALTLSGEIEFFREVFHCRRCRCSLAPVDEELTLWRGAKMTRSVVRKAAWAGARSSFAQASRDVAELAGLSISAAEMARIADEEGARVGALESVRQAEWNQPVDPVYRPTPEVEFRPERLVLQADATTVLTVAGEEHKSVYCAVAFGLDSRGRKEDSGRPFLSERRYAASGHSLEDFTPRLKALGWRMGMRSAEAVAFIGDGAAWLWNWAEGNLPADTVFIQDFWHVCQHLADLAQQLFGARWPGRYQRWKRALRAGRVDGILRSLRRERQRHAGELRQAIDAEITYLSNGRSRMDYARFEADGWPIGSGAVEATCKHLVKERFALTGAHWRRANIPHVLALRLSIANQQWEADWQELQAA